MTQEYSSGKQLQALEATTGDGRAVSVGVVHISSGKPGPVVAVFAAMHGTEYASVAALGRLIQHLDPARVAGTLRVVPVANRLAFETRTMYVSPSDGKNLNRTFPGRRDGSYTEVLADLLWRNVVDGVDAVVDVHGGEVVEGLFPFAGAYMTADRPQVGELSRRLAEAFHPPYLVLNQVAAEVSRTGQRLSLLATDAGIPSVLVEAGSRGKLDEADIRFIHDGMLNAMRVMNMLAEPVEPAPVAPVVVRELPVIASQTGLFHATVAPGDRVKPGQELGTTIDYTGATVERFVAEWDGVILGVIGPAVVTGGMPLVIGVVADGWAPHQPLSETPDMLDLDRIPLVDDHSHAGLYERRLGRFQRLADLEGRDEHYTTSTYRALLRQALQELYGDVSQWAEGVDKQYGDGIQAAYVRVLDRLGVRTTLWDFRRLSRDDWPSDRFRLIYWLDPFVLPFEDPTLWRAEELQGALEEALGLAGLAALPTTLADYLTFVGTTLRWARPRLVGLKLALGYQRSLTFAEVQHVAAGRAYSALLRGDRGAYRDFQDFMVRWLFHLAGELELPLQIHASFGGPGSHLRLANNDPAQLQPLLEDPSNRATRVVLLHGAYPYTSRAAVLAWNYPHVWLDFSVLPTLFGRSLARWLEEWIELLPRHKLLFGSDASSPEEYYTAALNGRRQLAVALDNLSQAGTLSLKSAIDLAERICQRNAIELYGLRELHSTDDEDHL